MTNAIIWLHPSFARARARFFQWTSRFERRSCFKIRIRYEIGGNCESARPRPLVREGWTERYRARELPATVMYAYNERDHPAHLFLRPERWRFNLDHWKLFAGPIEPHRQRRRYVDYASGCWESRDKKTLITLIKNLDLSSRSDYIWFTYDLVAKTSALDFLSDEWTNSCLICWDCAIKRRW